MKHHPEFANATAPELLPAGMSLTHRCIDCHPSKEHSEAELCMACGRCADHCHSTDLCKD